MQYSKTLLSQDEDGDAKVGNAIRLYDCKNCVVYTADESKVVVESLNGYFRMKRWSWIKFYIGRYYEQSKRF